MFKDTPAIAAVPFRPGTPWHLLRFDTPEEGAAGGDGGAGEGADKRPEWLPENFKSPEDLAKSYAEAERKIHELAAAAKDKERLEQENREWQEWAAEQERQSRQPTGDPREKFLEVWEDPDRQADLVLHMATQMAELQQQIAASQQRGPDPGQAQITADLAQRALRERFSDWDEFAPQVSEVVSEHPTILGLTEQSNLTDVVRGLESVYWMEKGKALSTDEGRAAFDAAEAARLAKQQALTQSGSSARPATQSDEDAYRARLLEIARASGDYGT